MEKKIEKTLIIFSCVLIFLVLFSSLLSTFIFYTNFYFFASTFLKSRKYVPRVTGQLDKTPYSLIFVISLYERHGTLLSNT